jgi:hypothetical protein
MAKTIQNGSFIIIKETEEEKFWTSQDINITTKKADGVKLFLIRMKKEVN